MSTSFSALFMTCIFYSIPNYQPSIFKLGLNKYLRDGLYGLMYDLLHCSK
jgi:hypothetical protein